MGAKAVWSFSPPSLGLTNFRNPPTCEFQQSMCQVGMCGGRGAGLGIGWAKADRLTSSNSSKSGYNNWLKICFPGKGQLYGKDVVLPQQKHTLKNRDLGFWTNHAYTINPFKDEIQYHCSPEKGVFSDWNLYLKPRRPFSEGPSLCNRVKWLEMPPTCQINICMSTLMKISFRVNIGKNFVMFFGITSKGPAALKSNLIVIYKSNKHCP